MVVVEKEVEGMLNRRTAASYNFSPEENLILLGRRRIAASFPACRRNGCNLGLSIPIMIPNNG